MTDDFIELFKKLEKITKQKYKEIFKAESELLDRKAFKDIVHELGVNGIYPYNKHYNVIYYCANVRNVCVHNSKISNDYLVQPNKYLYDELKKIINLVENPKKIIDIAILDNNIYKSNLDNKVKETIKIMNDKTYTHIPILHQNKLYGLFCEKTLLNFINNNKQVSINYDTRFEEIKGYLELKEYKDIIKFMSKDVLVDELIKTFKDDFVNRKKLECIFITDTGNENGKLLGLITIWDVLGKYI